jgi:hypothetical protein
MIQKRWGHMVSREKVRYLAWFQSFLEALYTTRSPIENQDDPKRMKGISIWKVSKVGVSMIAISVRRHSST